MYNPWDDLANLPGWRVDWCHVGPRLGVTRWSERLILLDWHLSSAVERSVLTHEILHATRGPFPRWLTAREEEAVSRASARLLIDLADLEKALRWSADPDEIADELGVDRATLEARIRGLHPAERHHLARRLEES